jgi:hypothetical protein
VPPKCRFAVLAIDIFLFELAHHYFDATSP